MERELRNLRKAMNSSTHKGTRFTEAQKENIWSALQQEKFKANRKPKLSIYLIAPIAASLFVLIFFTEIMSSFAPNEEIHQGAKQSLESEWKIRTAYYSKNKLLFSVFPDPFLTEGKPTGYIFSFKEPFEIYKGKEIEINAISEETGEILNVVPNQVIVEPSPGYETLERFTIVDFTIPNAGLWKYEVYLDNKLYGDVVLSVKNEKFTKIFLPENLPKFVQRRDFEQIDWNRKAVHIGNNILGNLNKSGVIGADIRSVNINQKWMWHLWGIESPTELTVVGYHRKESTVYPILTGGWSIQLGGENNGADAHAPSSVNLPHRGEWAILLYVDEKLFDVLVFNINS